MDFKRKQFRKAAEEQFSDEEIEQFGDADSKRLRKPKKQLFVDAEDKKRRKAKKLQFSDSENEQFNEVGNKRLWKTRKQQFGHVRKGWLNEGHNSWCREFSTFRKIHYDKRLVDVTADAENEEETDPLRDTLEIFFVPSGNMDPQFEVRGIKNFCRGKSLTDVIGAKGLAGRDRIAWIDDRSTGPDSEDRTCAREYKNPLTATGLYRALDNPRFNHEHLPDASRRLIYVTDLSPACIHALVATASSLQAEALRDAICNHLACQTSIAVKIPSAGMRTFELVMHLPVFKLEKSTPPPKESREKGYTKPRRAWTDLSFLNLDACESQGEVQDPKEVWGLQEAHISCVVAGTDNWRWIGYGFVDAEIDGILADSDLEELEFDQIAAQKLNANTPIWCPRDYWVKVFEIRIGYIRKQWLHLIRTLEEGVDLYIKEHSPALSSGSGTREKSAQVKADFDWAHQISDILSQLYSVLSGTIAAWKLFNLPREDSGDIGYFRGISANAQLSLRAIGLIFRELEGDEKRLDLLRSRCSEFSRALELRLQTEVREAAFENGAIAELNSGLFYPIALSAAIFSMQQEALPFKMSPRSFGFSVPLLIVVVYAIRIIFKYALSQWPGLKRRVRSWIKRDRMNEGNNVLQEEIGENEV